MDSDSIEMVKEIKDKVILHWNCRGLVEFPEVIRTYGGHIQEIYLKWNKLSTLPSWIIELVNVTNLYMYGNLIKELPPELGKMQQLTVLDLSTNKLENIHPCIGSLSNLKSLFLNDNDITKLPSEMSQLINLEILSIARNKFLALPEWIGSLPKLRELNADNNSLKELPNRLTLAPKLSMISVCSNSLSYPRQMEYFGLWLLKVHNIYENTTVSLWELSLRKVYIERYNHSLDISMSPVKINIFFEPIVKNQSLDFTIQSVHCASYTLLFNGPTSICLNAHCQQPIFTEAWVVIGTNHHAEFITAVSLCCCKRCAVEFSMHCGMIINVDWHCIT
ncbi:hypothetical protein KM043_015493 [Ampulex compressa]|nr:hypothetical protein KM043_015493 [Ampulex compressa]